MRKLLLLLILANSIQFAAFSQYWQQQVNYTIDVSLNDKEHTLDGFEKMDYFNNSPDTLHFIWMHIWPNAYKNDKTAFSDHMLENGGTKFYFSDKEDKGYINRLNFKVDNITAQVEDHPQHIDIVKIILPSPLPPGGKTTITTPFHVKLPFNFSRGGHDGQSYQATQWYPKPAVYDKNGWHPMPYLDQGEFYSEFGSFDVTITVPKNYVVAATGELENQSEKDWLKSRATYNWVPIKQTQKIKGGGVKTTLQPFPPTDAETKTIKYSQQNVHDFAWFADKRFIVQTDTCLLASGKIIQVYTYYTPLHQVSWKNSVQYAKDAIRHYSSLVGEYPYSIVSVVQGPPSFGGGMEYPTITVISEGGSTEELDNTIAHEIGHNWFYGILATNEREHAWMDEGINSYYDDKYKNSKYGQSIQWERLYFETKVREKTDQPIELSSEKFSEFNYYSTAYYKTGAWMRYMESQLGTEVFNRSMHEYYSRWKFKHPQPEDFKKVMEETSNKNLDSAFAYLNKKGILPNQRRTGTTIAFIFNIKSLEKFAKDTGQELITIGPVIGFNEYDKLIAGAFVTNIKLPPSSFQFFLAPAYATGTSDFAGTGFIMHTLFPGSLFRKIDISTRASIFTADKFTYGNAIDLFLRYQRIIPGIKFTFNEPNPRSHLNKFIRFKSYFIGEDRLKFSRDSVFAPPDTIITERYGAIRSNRTLNQLQLVIDNRRALYPYRGELTIEQGKFFIRTGFTGKYFFNYPKGGGLDLRLFAGKFFYTATRTSSKEFATERFHLNLFAPNGFEDYTYSNYFVGRNKFEGLASQQVMERDGAMKLRLEQFEGDPEFK